jgi:hypothetical protein
MQETDFILQNKDKWQEFESVLQSKDKDPERLTDLFIETTDDLSFSRTYYPNRSVRVYLNGISQQVYQAIYKNKAREKNIFKKFWLEDLPEAMWHSRKALPGPFYCLCRAYPLVFCQACIIQNLRELYLVIHTSK